VSIELSNFKIGVSDRTIEAGGVTLLVEHQEERGHRAGGVGEMHDLAVLRLTDGGGRELVARSDTLHSGDSQDLRVTLDPGEYELMCTVVEEYRGRTISHADEGMRTTMTVRAAAGQ
jgi:hypothetical protein